MKVLHVIYSLKGGGAEAQLRLLVNASSKRGVTNFVYCVKDNASINAAQIYKAAKSHRYYLNAFREVRDIIMSIKPSIVHAWLPSPLTVPAMLAARTLGVPCVTSYRSRMLVDKPVKVVDLFARLICSDVIVSNNPVEQSGFLYRHLFKFKKGIVISNGIDVPVENLGLALDRIDSNRLLFVGRLVKLKNLEVLIEAMNLLNRAGKLSEEVRVEVFGEGPLEDYYQQKVEEKGLCEHVLFRGFSDKIDVEMQKGGILISTSLYEGMPNAVLEALSYGLPVLLSNIPGHRYLYSSEPDKAMYFDVHDARGLADLIMLLRSESFDLYSYAAGTNAIAGKFSTNAMVSSYIRLYREIGL